MSELRERLTNAWVGRVSGCMLGKPVEALSMRRGHQALDDYLAGTGALPLRDYVPLTADADPLVEASRGCCRGHLTRAEPDDDVNYSVLALMLLERHGAELTTADVARGWLKLLPVGSTFTAERAAYRLLLQHGAEWFAEGADPGFDLVLCSDNPFNDWIGAQIRADVYGWTTPGRVDLAADLARRDAQLSHRADGVYGAVIVAAWGAAIPEHGVSDALTLAQAQIPDASAARAAIDLGRRVAGDPNGGGTIRGAYPELSPVHTLNNLALVVWALLTWPDDYSAAVGEVVAAGWDTDCNGATVGGLWGLQGKPVPDHWGQAWHGRIATGLAGYSELALDDLVDRTVAVTEALTA